MSLAGSPIDSFTLGAGAAVRKNYPGQNNGPMFVGSSGQPILATIRVLFGGGSYSEMMGLPGTSAAEFYIFPWYDNVGADTQVRVSNIGGSSTTITVSLNGSPIDSYSLGAGAAIRKNYAALNNGDLHVESSGQPILATERILYGGTSFYELMGFPVNVLTSTQYFPWYNNTAMNSQLRFTVP